MGFQFRFNSLLQLRCRERDEAGNEVGKADEAIRRVEEQRDELQQQRDEIRAQANGILGVGSGSTNANLSVDRMLQRGRYDLQLQAEQISLEQTIATLQKERDRRRDLLVQAEAEVKRLEKLRETQADQHRQAELQREQAEADDLTTARMVIARLNASKGTVRGPIS